MRILQRQGGQWRALGAQMTPLQPSTMATPMTHETPPTLPKNATEKQLIVIDHKWVDAATNGDTQYLQSLFTERMFEVGGDGRTSDAEALLKGIGARKPGQFQGFCDQIVNSRDLWQHGGADGPARAERHGAQRADRSMRNGALRACW